MSTQPRNNAELNAEVLRLNEVIVELKDELHIVRRTLLTIGAATGVPGVLLDEIMKTQR